jgi:hypothetical protein
MFGCAAEKHIFVIAKLYFPVERCMVTFHFVQRVSTIIVSVGQCASSSTTISTPGRIVSTGLAFEIEQGYRWDITKGCVVIHISYASAG